MKKILLFLFISVQIFQAKSTHIVGGELNYRYLGNNQYEIRLTVYRDCYFGQPSFDNPASLGIFDQNNNLVTSIYLNLLAVDTIDKNINAPCLPVPPNICYEVTTYIDTIVLPPNPGGYQLAYQRCCRGNSILNISSPETTGVTFYASIPGNITNSNPVFLNLPPVFSCVNTSFIFDYSAIDPDGDSLVYELCYPLEGANLTNPMPQPPNPPPYQQLQFQSPYYLGNVLGGSQPLSIDPVSGILTGVPGILGRFVYSVCTKEYRNGIFLGTTQRDFELNVTPGFVDISELSSDNALKIYPNPTTTLVNIHFNNEKESNYVLNVLDIYGRIIIEENLQTVKGINDFTFDVEFLSKGIYMIELTTANERMMKKLVVQ